MRTTLTKSLWFDAAHWLPTFPEGHKCQRLHGHSFRVDVVLTGETQEPQGYLVDYGQIKQVAQEAIDQLDHRLLNDIEGLTNPTAEHIAKWLYERIEPKLPQLAAIRVHETPSSVAEYCG